MNRYDIYILQQFLIYFLGTLGIFTVFFVGVDALSTMMDFNNLSAGILFKYYGFSLPAVVHQMLPIACLISVVFVLAGMNRTNELTALHSCGMSLMRICMPVILCVGLICMIAYVMSDRILPVTNREKDFIYYHDIKKTPGLFSVIKTDRIWYRNKSTLFNIKTLNPATSKAQGLTMYFFDSEWNLMQMIQAEEVNIQGKQWELLDGSVSLVSGDGSFPLTSKFKSKILTVGEDSKDLTVTGQTSDSLSQAELSYFIDKNKSAGLDTVRYEVDYHAKFGFAFCSLIMVLLGIPLSVQKGRNTGSMKNAALCLGVVFFYWILYSSSLKLGQFGHLAPILAAWMPNFLMACLAFFLSIRQRM